MSFEKNPIESLLERGYSVCIENGRLLISSPAGELLPQSTIAKYFDILVEDIASRLKQPTYLYSSFSVGYYGQHKKAGVTLQFESPDRMESYYAIFNVELERKRTTTKHKAGSRYPKGQFAVKKKSLFKRFWRVAGLKPLKSDTRYWQSMGKLKQIIFIGDVHESKNGKLINQSLTTLNLSEFEVGALYITDSKVTHKNSISHTLGTHTEHIIVTHIEKPETPIYKGLDRVLGTGSVECVKEIKEQRYQGKRIEESSNTQDEWLNSFDPNGELDNLPF